MVPCVWDLQTSSLDITGPVLLGLLCLHSRGVALEAMQTPPQHCYSFFCSLRWWTTYLSMDPTSFCLLVGGVTSAGGMFPWVTGEEFWGRWQLSIRAVTLESLSQSLSDLADVVTVFETCIFISSTGTWQHRPAGYWGVWRVAHLLLVSCSPPEAPPPPPPIASGSTHRSPFSPPPPSLAFPPSAENTHTFDTLFNTHTKSFIPKLVDQCIQGSVSPTIILEGRPAPPGRSS